ncbi:hypothetical protein CLOP_g2891 [Closterium sp. NIES-67]|nr:hypothetical protein CLOP_g2891 [Closterium sp. NIES-67]
MRCADATELCSALLWTPKSGRCGAAQDAMASAVWDDSMAAAVPHCVIAEGCSDAQDAQGAMMAGAVRLVECSSAVDDSAVATSGVAWLPDPLAALPVPPAGLDDVTFLSWEEMDLCPWGRPHHEDRQGRQDSEEDPHAALDVPPMGSCLNSSGVESSVRGAYEIMGGGVAEPPPGAPMGGVMLGEGGEQAGVDELQAGMLQQEQQQEQQQNQHVHHPVFDVLGGGNSMSVWDFIH